MDIRETGMYILWVSNCGNVNGAVVSGSIVVKNPYGFLPGNEYHKMPFYGWLGILYMALAGIWLSLSIWWWKELFSIQNCIAGVILLGLVESFLWYAFFADWNSSGNHSRPLFTASVFSSVAKSAFSYMLVLVASLGWGVTRPYLDDWSHNRIRLICVVYVGLGVIREVVLSYSDSQNLALWLVLICLLPVALINGVIFYWVFTALSNLIETLRERRQSEKLIVFQRLWCVLILTMGVATVFLLYQIFSLSHNGTSWRREWLFTDGVSHILFFFVLVVMMYLWAPHKHSQRYAYSHQVDSLEFGHRPGSNGDKIEKSSVWVEDEDEDDLETERLCQQLDGYGNSPVVIGASSSGLCDTIREMELIGIEEPIVKVE